MTVPDTGSIVIRIPLMLNSLSNKHSHSKPFKLQDTVIGHRIKWHIVKCIVSSIKLVKHVVIAWYMLQHVVKDTCVHGSN